MLPKEALQFYPFALLGLIELGGLLCLLPALFQKEDLGAGRPTNLFSRARDIFLLMPFRQGADSLQNSLVQFRLRDVGKAEASRLQVFRSADTPSHDFFVAVDISGHSAVRADIVAHTRRSERVYLLVNRPLLVLLWALEGRLLCRREFA